MPKFSELTPKDWTNYTKIIVSLVILLAALGIILSKAYPEDYNKWAFGMVGAVFGYWCK